MSNNLDVCDEPNDSKWRCNYFATLHANLMEDLSELAYIRTGEEVDVFREVRLATMLTAYLVAIFMP